MRAVVARRPAYGARPAIVALAALGPVVPGAEQVWGQCETNELVKLTASDATAGDRFGHSVSFSGTTALIAAPLSDDPPNSGSVYFYRFDGARWIEEATFSASDPGDFENFGWSVAHSGSRAVIGAILDDEACPQVEGGDLGQHPGIEVLAVVRSVCDRSPP